MFAGRSYSDSRGLRFMESSHESNNLRNLNIALSDSQTNPNIQIQEVSVYLQKIEILLQILEVSNLRIMRRRPENADTNQNRRNETDQNENRSESKSNNISGNELDRSHHNNSGNDSLPNEESSKIVSEVDVETIASQKTVPMNLTTIIPI